MADLASLFSALAETQQKKSSTRLSERNVIELVNKLKQLGIIQEEDLLHTINGKEYLTTQRLKQEILQALKQAGGRLSLVELPALLGVDLVHCEKQAAALVAESGGAIQEAQGELLTTQFFESVASEINDMLQESGQLSVAELALQYQIQTELLLSILSQHLGTRIQGRLEGGLLYTPAALRRVKAQLRGALRGAVQPCTLMSVVKEVGLEGFGTQGGVVGSLVEELLAVGEVAGALKAGGLSWTPQVYASAQQSALTAFYEQNGWVGYDMARKLGYERAHLSKVFPGGLALDSVYVRPTILAHMTAGIEEALAGGTWVDVAPLIPSVFNTADVAALMEHVPQLSAAPQAATAGQGAAGGRGTPKPAAALMGGVACVVANTCVVAAPLMATMQAEVEQLAREGADKALKEKKALSGAKTNAPQQQAAAAKASSKAQDDEDDDDDWGTGPKKGKGGKGGKGGAAPKGKTGSKGSKQADAGDGGPAGVGAPGITTDQLEDHILALHPDMEGAGEGNMARQLAKALLHRAVAAWEAALVAAFTAGAEGRRQAKEALTKALEDAFLRMCLYSSGLELFSSAAASTPYNSPADSLTSTSTTTANAAAAVASGGKAGKAGKGGKAAAGAAGGAVDGGAADGEDAMFQTMERHVVRTAGGECVDLMFKWVQVEVSGTQGEGSAGPNAAAAPATAASRGAPLSQAERAAVVRSAPPDMAAALHAAAEAVAQTSTKAAAAALESAADQLGLRLKRPEKKAEKAGVAAVRSGLMAQLATEQDPAAALALLVPLLFIKATGRAIQLPGKAISTVLNHIRQDLPTEHLAAVQQFHTQVVEYLKICSVPGAAGSAALSEALSAQLPSVKTLVGVE